VCHALLLLLLLLLPLLNVYLRIDADGMVQRKYSVTWSTRQERSTWSSVHKQS